MAKRGKFTRLLTAAEDVAKLSDLAQDIRDATMDYQVRTRRARCSPPNVRARHPYSKTSTRKVAG